MKCSIFIILLVSILTSCSDQHERRNNVYRPEFDVSSDDKNIICSYYEDDKASIYKIELENNKKTKILATGDYSLIKPIYSPDNKKIACIAASSENTKNKICLIDIRSKKIVELTDDSLMVLEVVFDPSGRSIYFTAAADFTNYSPVLRKAAHDIDIYQIDIETREIQKITNFNSYSLHGLSIAKEGDSLLFRLITHGNNGLYLMDIKSNGLTQINSINDLRVEKKATPYEYYSPILAKDNSKIAFSEPYELYIMDRKTRISKLIFRNETPLLNVGDSKFFYSGKYLIISLPIDNKGANSTGYNFGFFMLNPETNELKALMH